jgi:DNA polymerase III epsilon subunit family exonuclease
MSVASTFSSALTRSMFHAVIYPDGNTLGEDSSSSNSSKDESLTLRRVVRFVPPPSARIDEIPIVVFDFETTGLDVNQDQIIEIGAEKLIGFEVVDTFSTLITTSIGLSSHIQQLTGITPDMLTGQPELQEVLPEFLKFIDGSLMAAHNAEFDFMMLKAAALRMGYEVDLPCFCTLKMARTLLPTLENRKLDTLAQHYNLTFGSRHRSMGDVRVTSEVLRNLVTVEADGIECWKDLEPFNVT